MSEPYTPTTDEMIDAYVQQALAESGEKDPLKRLVLAVGFEAEADRWRAALTEPTEADIDPRTAGTGAGEGASGQDTDSAWVTPSTDCPEAPAQASRAGLTRIIRSVTDLWDDPLDEVHDVPQIVNALLAAGVRFVGDRP